MMAQTGVVKDNLIIPSKILKMDRKYAIYFLRITILQSVVILYYTCCMGRVMIRQAGCSSVKS